LTLPAALVASLLAEESAPAALPAALVRTAVHTARAGSGDGVSASVALLAESAQGGTATVKVKMIVGLLLLTGTLAVGAGALAPPPVADAPSSPAANVPERARAEKQTPARSDDVSSVGFSPDGRILATASSRDKTIRLWEVWSGQSRGSITGHADWVNSLAFSPFGSLASASHDKTIRIWNLNTGQETGCFRGHNGVVGPLAFSSDGRRLISGGWDTTILVWDMNALPQPQAAKLVELSPKELDAFWADLADADASKAFRSIRTLIRARQQAVSFLKERLRPIAPVAAEEITAWIADLDNERFETRSKAKAELEKVEELAEPALRRALRKEPSSLEARRRLEALLQRLEGPVTSTETLRRLRAVEALEHIGSPEARQVLQTLTEGAPQALLTRQAKAALKRLTHDSSNTP
jgi:hypothetical protein